MSRRPCFAAAVPRIRTLLRVGLALWASTALLLAQGQGWLVDSTTDTLYSVNLGTGRARAVASTLFNGLSAPADLAWDETHRELWTIDFAGGEVGTIDTTTGFFRRVGTASPTTGWQGCAWDAAGRRLVLSNQDDHLYSFDTTTGTTAPIGAMGVGLVGALDFDANGVLWGVEFFTGSLLQLDPATAAANVVGVLPPGIQDLAVDVAAGVLYAANSNDDSLHRTDLATQTQVFVRSFGAGVIVPKGFDLAGPACTGAITVTGTGCADAGGIDLHLSGVGLPCRGGYLELSLASSGSALYTLVMGVDAQLWRGLILPFDLGAVGASGCRLYTSQDLLLGPLLPAATTSFTIPPDPGLAGVATFWQAFVFDPAIPRTLPLASSDAVRVVIG